jgi:hypothetical protein
MYCVCKVHKYYSWSINVKNLKISCDSLLDSKACDAGNRISGWRGTSRRTGTGSSSTQDRRLLKFTPKRSSEDPRYLLQLKGLCHEMNIFLRLIIIKRY